MTDLRRYGVCVCVWVCVCVCVYTLYIYNGILVIQKNELLYIKYISDKDLPYSTGNPESESVSYSMVSNSL